MVNDAIEVLGWTLLHFVWQGAAVGVLAAALLIALRRRSANARYLTAVSALSLMLLLPIGTMAWIEQMPPVGEVSPMFNTVSMVEIPRTREDGTLALDEPPIKIDFENPPPAEAVPLIPISDTGQSILEDLAEQRFGFGVESSLKPFMPWAVATWLIGVGVLSLRLFSSWLSVQRLRRRATQPASENWQAILHRIADRLRVTRPVKLVESALVEVPTVIGWMKPIILLPASAMTGLTTEQLEALLAHELAHVRRHDYLVNLLQTVVETLLFYHPAVWWLSHRIRVEREHCCDDLAASVCGDRLSYAKALVAMEALRAPPLGLAMSACGGSLLSRVARLLRPTESQRQPVGWLAGLIVMLTLTLAGALGAGLLTPPDKPTEGLPNRTTSTETQSNDTTPETSDPDQRRGQKARAQRVIISGEVTTAENNPVADAEVFLPFDLSNGLPDQEHCEITRTDQEGRYRFEVSSREYFDDAIKGYSFLVWAHRPGTGMGISIIERPTNGKKECVSNIQLRPGRPFVVRVLDPDDQPIADATIRPSGMTTPTNQFPVPTKFSKRMSVRTNSEGRAEISEISEMIWFVLQVDTKSFGTQALYYFDPLPKPLNELVYTLKRTARVRGSISSTPRPKNHANASGYLVTRWNELQKEIPRGERQLMVGAPNLRINRLLDSEGNFDLFVPEGRYHFEFNHDFDVQYGTTTTLRVDGEKVEIEQQPTPETVVGREPVKRGNFIGRVCLKLDGEKPLPDLSNVKLPPGKILDESLVFSKDGGVANVFVSLWKPRFRIEPATEVELAKPFVLIAESGKFWPHAALVRVGRPVVFENGSAEPINFVTQPLRNQSFNVLVKPEDRFKAPAFEKSENIPVPVKSNIKPWMLAHLLPLDHPFASVTDDDGRFAINGLPPGEHEFRVWHERVGWLEKSLIITIKAGEDARSELDYAPDRLKLTEAEVLGWGNRQINAIRIPRAIVPAFAPAPRDAEAVIEKSNQRIRNELQKVSGAVFANAHLDFVRAYLGEQHGISIEFDPSVRNRIKDFSQIPITLQVEGEDLKMVLACVLHASQLSYFVDAGTLWIATPEEVRRRGQPIPSSFADLVIQLQEVDDSLPWQQLLLGQKPSQPETPQQIGVQVERLVKLLSDAEPLVKRHAAHALARFDRNAAPARPILEPLTQSDDRAVRRAAWWALLGIGHDDLSTWPLFLAAWLERNQEVEEDWFRFLGHFDGKVFEKLVKLYPSASAGVRRKIAASIRVWPGSKATLPLTLLAFEDEDQQARQIALTASEHVLDDPLLESLRKRLRDDSPLCRIAAASRLLHSDGDREVAVDLLLNELSEDDATRRKQALAAFEKYGRFHTTVPVRGLLLRRTVTTREPQRLAAKQALKVVPEEKQTAGTLKHIDVLFESRKNEPKLSPAQRVQALDEEMQNLLTRNNPSEEQRARVNHRVAHQFANWDIRQHFALVWKYAEAGLRLDVDPARRASLHSLLGSAALVNSETKTFAEQRRNAAMFWLSGYREVVSLKLPKTAPELPVVEKLGDLSRESAEQRAAREQQHAAQIEVRQQAEFIRQMVEHRHQLARLLVETYQRAPADEIELRMLAKEALIENSLVELLLAEGAVPLGASDPSKSK